MAPVAKEFDKIIQDGRERKRNEALASKIFSKNRRQSAPSKLKPSSAGASLASRVGVRKQQIPQRAISFGRRASVPSGNVKGEWTHDLHNSFSSKPASKKAAGGLGARITQPGANKASPVAAGGSTSKKAAKRHAKLAAAVGDAMDTDSDQVNIVHPPPAAAAAAKGLTIRGLAGPFAVLGQNFAPGTTPADVESAMTPIGGEMISCNVVKTQPFLIMEMVFASREGGERVIEMFNNKTADGRVIKIYPKIGGYQQPTTAAAAATKNNNAASNGAPANAPTGPRSARNHVVDGTMGFGVDVTRNSSSGGGGNNGSGGGLYSDKMISSGRRGGGRGGRGRGR